MTRFWPNRPDPARIGAESGNPCGRTWPDAAPTRSQWCPSCIAASRRVGRGCDGSGAASVHRNTARVVNIVPTMQALSYTYRIPHHHCSSCLPKRQPLQYINKREEARKISVCVWACKELYIVFLIMNTVNITDCKEILVCQHL